MATEMELRNGFSAQEMTMITRININGNEYLIEQSQNGLRVGVVIISTGQSPYVRWLRTDGKRAAKVVRTVTRTRTKTTVRESKTGRS